jgi:hypothetical protein
MNMAAVGLLALVASAQDVKLNITYVCNGERVYVESCNIRDVSDTSTCMRGCDEGEENNYGMFMPVLAVWLKRNGLILLPSDALALAIMPEGGALKPALANYQIVSLHAKEA